MNIKLDHINLTVAHLDESVAWYKTVFGFELVESGKTAQGIRWGIIACEDSMICMTEFTQRNQADLDQDKSHHRIYHFGIRVSDMGRWRETVKEQIYSWLEGDFITGCDGLLSHLLAIEESL